MIDDPNRSVAGVAVWRKGFGEGVALLRTALWVVRVFGKSATMAYAISKRSRVTHQSESEMCSHFLQLAGQQADELHICGKGVRRLKSILDDRHTHIITRMQHHIDLIVTTSLC